MTSSFTGGLIYWRLEWDQIDPQQPPVEIDRDMTLAADDLLAGAIAACLAVRRFGRLAVDHRGRRACFATLPFPVEHEFDVLDRLEREAPRQFAKPVVDRPPDAYGFCGSNADPNRIG